VISYGETWSDLAALLYQINIVEATVFIDKNIYEIYGDALDDMVIGNWLGVKDVPIKTIMESGDMIIRQTDHSDKWKQLTGKNWPHGCDDVTQEEYVPLVRSCVLKGIIRMLYINNE